MFTEEDLGELVPAVIFQRGLAYYESQSVGQIQRTGNTFNARVQGTKNYRVELTISPKSPPAIRCNCPYDYGIVCKHGIALGLAVLDVLEAPAVPKKTVVPAPKLTEKAKQRLLLKNAWSRTSKKQKLTFLKTLLAEKAKYLQQFLEAHELDESRLLAPPEPPLPRIVPVRGQRGRNAVGKAPRPAARIAAARPLPRPTPPPRLLTLAEKAHKLLAARKGPELLPLLLEADWLLEPPLWDTQLLPLLLAQAAEFRPEATLDAVMERFETYLETPATRSPALYGRVSGCLKKLALVPRLTEQVKLFASELLRQYTRLPLLRQSLGGAGFALLVSEMETGHLPKKRGRKPGLKKP